MLALPLSVGLIATSGGAPVPTRTPQRHAVIQTPVAASVAQALAGAPIPATTNPSIYGASNDHVNLGACSAFGKVRSAICNYGASNGSKAIVIFGNSHAAMWVPAIAAAARSANYRFYPFVKEACAFEAFTAAVPKFSPHNACAIWYRWARKQIAVLHPAILIVGSYVSTQYWRQGEITAVAQLKPLTRRLILFGDDPHISDPATCLLAPGATQRSCLHPESASSRRAAGEVAAVARRERVRFFDVTPWFCSNGLCPSIIDGYIPYVEGSHVTEAYSVALAPEMRGALGIGPATVAVIPPRPAVTRAGASGIIWDPSSLVSFGRWSGDGMRATITAASFSAGWPNGSSQWVALVFKKVGAGSAVCAATEFDPATGTVSPGANLAGVWPTGWYPSSAQPFPCGSHPITLRASIGQLSFESPSGSACGTVTWQTASAYTIQTFSTGGSWCDSYALLVY